MKKWFAACMIIAVLISAGCVGEKKPEIKAGVLITFTGGLGQFGEAMANGAILAADEINKAGGINGSTITLIIEDTGTDPAKAAEAAKKLIDVDGVQVIIGAVSSTETLAVAPIAERSKVVLISPSSTAPSITDAGEYIFRVVGSDNLQGEAITRLATAKNYTKAATLVENNDYGIGLENVFRSNFKGNIVAGVRYEKGKGDYRTELDAIKNANPQVIIYVGYPAEASTILQQARSLGLEAKWIAAEGIADPVMFENAEVAGQMEGMLLTRPTSPEQNPEYRNFVKLYRDAYGKEPGIYSDTEYDAVMLAALAIREAGNNGEKIKNALPEVSITYKAVTGNKTFDENGDVPQDYTVLEVKNGTMVAIGNWSTASGIRFG